MFAHLDVYILDTAGGRAKHRSLVARGGEHTLAALDGAVGHRRAVTSVQRSGADPHGYVGALASVDGCVGAIVRGTPDAPDPNAVQV